MISILSFCGYMFSREEASPIQDLSLPRSIWRPSFWYCPFLCGYLPQQSNPHCSCWKLFAPYFWNCPICALSLQIACHQENPENEDCSLGEFLHLQRDFNRRCSSLLLSSRWNLASTRKCFSQIISYANIRRAILHASSPFFSLFSALNCWK